ncbi:match to protein family HMM PF08241 [Arthrobacter sp. Hiyo4]|nr:match to protein family HMM PF08241 [Arthrobacter sp. Hiyo4]
MLDIGCGTGLNFPLLQERIGAAGTIVGIDRSAGMLRQARRRAEARGWQNVILIQADMVLLDPGSIAARIQASGARGLRCRPCDLLVIPHAGLAAGVDEHDRTARPACTGRGGGYAGPGALGALAHSAGAAGLRAGGSDISAAPWRAVEERCVDVVRASARGGHLQIRAGKIMHDG